MSNKGRVSIIVFTSYNLLVFHLFCYSVARVRRSEVQNWNWTQGTDFKGKNPCVRRRN